MQYRQHGSGRRIKLALHLVGMEELVTSFGLFALRTVETQR